MAKGRTSRKPRPAAKKPPAPKKIFGFAPREWIFLAKFLVLFAIPYALIHVADLSFFASAIASIQASLFNAAGIASHAAGPIVFAGADSYTIIADCTGLVMVSMLFALLWASPLKDERRWLFLAAGAPLLLAFNILRLFLTLYSGAAFGPAAIEAAHVGFWFVDSALVVAIWAKAARLW